MGMQKGVDLDKDDENSTYDYIAVTSNDLHSLGNVCRRVQNATISRAKMIDTRITSLDNRISHLIRRRGGYFKMTTVRSEYEEQFQTALVPSLFGVRWVKDVMALLVYSVKIVPIEDDMLIMAATEESIWSNTNQRLHILAEIHRAQHLTEAPLQRVKEVKKMCEDVVLPLLREISEDYAMELKFDHEFCQVLNVLDQFGQLKTFLSSVKEKWLGKQLPRAPHAWLDGIARSILRDLSMVHDVTKLKSNHISQSTENLDNFWDAIYAMRKKRSIDPIGSSRAKLDLSCSLWKDTKWWCALHSTLNDRVEMKCPSPEASKKFFTLGQHDILKCDLECDDKANQLTPKSKNQMLIQDTPTEPKSATISVAVRDSPSGVEESIPTSTRRGPAIQLAMEFDLEAEDDVNGDENLLELNVSDNPATLEDAEGVQNIEDESQTKFRSTLEEIYDGLELTDDAKKKLRSADVVDVQNLANFREKDLIELRLKMASRVKLRALIVYMKQNPERFTAAPLA